MRRRWACVCMGACTRQSEALSQYSHSYCSAIHGHRSGTAVYLARNGNNSWARGKGIGSIDSPLSSGKFMFSGHGDRVCSEPLCMSASKGQKRRGGKVVPVAEGVNSVRGAANNTACPPLPQELNLNTRQGYAALFRYYGMAGATRKLVIAMEEARDKGLLTVHLALEAMNFLIDSRRTDLVQHVVSLLDFEQWEEFFRNSPTDAMMISRSLCRANAPDLAEQVMQAGQLMARLENHRESCIIESRMPGSSNEVNKEDKAALYALLASSWMRAGVRDRYLKILADIAQDRLPLAIRTANSLMRAAQKRKDSFAVFTLLDALAAARVPVNEVTYEILSNAVVRSVSFVTGAVSMETMPKRNIPEVGFIGRSNVGKSSLINMICNRRNLAFTSKRPGKTQQFNYFVVNGNVENGNDSGHPQNSESDAFYMVDVPGLGYAEAPSKVRDDWKHLLKQYVSNRGNLCVLFHLLDSRHGPLEQDSIIMRLVKEGQRCGGDFKYVIVLTKADKKGNTVARSVLEATVKALKDSEMPYTPIVVTSARSKLGRDGVWRYLKIVAIGGCNEK